MSFSQHQTAPVEVFYSYSHKDEKLRNKLNNHLALLQRQGLINGWTDRMIEAGDDWKHEVSKHLNTAQIILLLISADFIASDYCYSLEMERALERHKNGEARVIPILLRPVDWESSPFSQLQALPKDAKAVTTWKNRDEAFKNIAQGIRGVLKTNTVAVRQIDGQTPGVASPSTHEVDNKKRLPLSKNVGITLLIIAFVIGLSIAYGLYVFKSSQDAPAQPVKYAGRVVDSSTNQVILGAKVSVETRGVPQVYYTDSEGIFYLEIPAETDTTRIRVEAAGYEVFDRNVSLSRTGIEDVRLTSRAKDATPIQPQTNPSGTSDKISNASTATGNTRSRRAPSTRGKKKSPYDSLNYNEP